MSIDHRSSLELILSQRWPLLNPRNRDRQKELPPGQRADPTELDGKKKKPICRLELYHCLFSPSSEVEELKNIY